MGLPGRLKEIMYENHLAHRWHSNKLNCNDDGSDMRHVGGQWMVSSSRCQSCRSTYPGVHRLMKLERIQGASELRWEKIISLFSLNSNKNSVFPSIVNVGSNHSSIRSICNLVIDRNQNRVMKKTTKKKDTYYEKGRADRGRTKQLNQRKNSLSRRKGS